jgi:DNA-binding CsgD family transcriptional regulator
MNTSYTPLSSLRPSTQRGYVGDFADSVSVASAPSTDFIASAMDELACGVIIIDRYGHLLHSNVAAESLLMSGDCVVLVDSKVTVTHKADERSFNDALLGAATGKRSMVALGPLSHTSVAVVPLRNTSGQPSEPRIALMFSRAGVCESLMLSFFSRSYRLTATEERVLGLMCACLTAPEMAIQLKVGEATIRTHVRNICAKTNSNGIRDIVKRLAVLPPLMTAVMPSTRPSPALQCH